MKIRTQNSFYCAEFVKYVLDKANVETNLPELVKPEDFKLVKNLKVEYNGSLRKYRNKYIEIVEQKP